MAIPKVMTGARAVIKVAGKTVGIFESCSFNVNISSEPIFTLGRFSSSEITPTAYEAVTLQCSGFRVINGAGDGGGSPYNAKKKLVPTLGELLTYDSVSIDVYDRQAADGSLPIMSVANCIATSYSGGYNAKATSKVSISYTGTVMSDEAGVQVEGKAATELGS